MLYSSRTEVGCGMLKKKSTPPIMTTTSQVQHGRREHSTFETTTVLYLRWFCYSACNYVVHMKRSNCKTSPWCPWLSSSCCVLYVLTTQLFLFSSSLLTHFVSFITLSLFYWIAGNTSEPNKIELFGIHKEETKTITSNRKRQQIYILYLFYQHTRYVCGRE